MSGPSLPHAVPTARLLALALLVRLDHRGSAALKLCTCCAKLLTCPLKLRTCCDRALFSA